MATGNVKKYSGKLSIALAGCEVRLSFVKWLHDCYDRRCLESDGSCIISPPFYPVSPSFRKQLKQPILNEGDIGHNGWRVQYRSPKLVCSWKLQKKRQAIKARR